MQPGEGEKGRSARRPGPISGEEEEEGEEEERRSKEQMPMSVAKEMAEFRHP